VIAAVVLIGEIESMTDATAIVPVGSVAAVEIDIATTGTGNASRVVTGIGEMIEGRIGGDEIDTKSP
jgi:hypothetical protein